MTCVVHMYNRFRDSCITKSPNWNGYRNLSWWNAILWRCYKNSILPTWSTPELLPLWQPFQDYLLGTIPQYPPTSFASNPVFAFITLDDCPTNLDITSIDFVNCSFAMTHYIYQAIDSYFNGYEWWDSYPQIVIAASNS